MADLAELGLRIESQEVDTADKRLDKLTASASRAERATDSLAGGSKRATSALADMAEKIQAEMTALDGTARAAGQAARATDDLARSVREAELASKRYSVGLVDFNSHALAYVEHQKKLAATSRLTTYEMLNLTRNAADVGVQLAMMQNPIMVLIQQGPQIADVFQSAAARGVGLRAALAGIMAEITPLLATFGPWLAGLAAVGGAVWYLVDAHNKQAKAIKDLNDELKVQRDELSKISPYLFQTGTNADLAAEGQRNFDTWLKATNISLAEQNRLLRENTLNALNQKALEAADKLRRAQEEFERVNKRGPTMMASPGGFGVVAPVQATDPRNNPLYLRAQENLRDAEAAAKAIGEYLAKAGQAPDKAFMPQERSARSATAAVREHTRAIELETKAVEATKVVWPEAAALAESYAAALKSAKDAEADFAKGTNRLAEAGGPRSAFDNLVIQADQIADAVYRARDGIDEMHWAIRNHDWSSAFAGLLRSLKAVRDEFAQTGNFGGKVGAAAGLASGVGGAIGGRTGGFIQGAASGAAAGAVFGPWGAAIGGALGGAMSLFSKSAKKIQEQAEQLARDQKAHSDALANATAKRELEIQLMQLQGDAAGALAKSRQAELIGMDATNAALQQQVWALQDAKAAADERTALEIRLMNAVGDASGALALQRKQELDATSAANRSYLTQVQAVEDAATKVAAAHSALTDAYNAEAATIGATRDKFQGLFDSLKAFATSLDGIDNAGLSYGQARRNFLGVSASAATGNADALAGFQDSATAFLTASKANSATAQEYERDRATVRNALAAAQAAAGNQVSVADQQLAALNASVDGIVAVNKSVLSVRDALAAYTAAIAAQVAAASGAAATPPPAATGNMPVPRAADWGSYLTHYTDVAAEYARLSPNYLKALGIRSAVEFAQWHYEHHGQSEGRTPYAMGGMFTNGVVTQPTDFDASVMGEGGNPEAIVPLIRTPGGLGVRSSNAGNAEMLAALRSIEGRLERLEYPMQQTAINTGKGARETRKVRDQIDRLSDNGNALRVVDAA